METCAEQSDSEAGGSPPKRQWPPANSFPPLVLATVLSLDSHTAKRCMPKLDGLEGSNSCSLGDVSTAVGGWEIRGACDEAELTAQPIRTPAQQG